MTAAEEETIDIGSTEVISEADPPNPLQKLIAGFCSPSNISAVPSFENEDDANAQYAPDLTPQKNAAKHSREEKEDIQDAATIESSISDRGITLTDNKPDPTTIETQPEPEPEREPEPESETESSGTDKNAEQESKPEEDVSKKVIANRRKTGIENFIVACIVLLSTLLALEKLGYTTSMIGSSAGSGGNGLSSWIHAVDKSTIDETFTGETAKIQVDDEGDDEGEAEDSSAQTTVDDEGDNEGNDEGDDESEAEDSSAQTTVDEL